MTVKSLSYAPPQICAEPYDLDAQLCQASGAAFDDPENLGDLSWS